MIAIDKGHTDVVKTLIEAGTNVNQTDKVSVCAPLLYFISVHFALVQPVPIYMYVRFIVLNINVLSTTTTLDCLGLKYNMRQVCSSCSVLFSVVQQCLENKNKNKNTLRHILYVCMYMCTCSSITRNALVRVLS